MKKILKSRVFFFFLGAIIFCCGTVFAYSLIASNTGYTPKDTSWNVENVKAALDDLYDNRMVRDINLNISNITTVSMNVGINESFTNATYIYLLNKKIVSTTNTNGYKIENLEPETLYNLRVIVCTEDGKVHVGTKAQSTADAVWLYKDGVEYDLAGGFSIQGYVGGDNYTLTNYDTYMRLNVPSNKRATFMRENNLIDFSKYKTAYVKASNSNGNPSSTFISTRENYNGADINSGNLGLNYYFDAAGEYMAVFDVSSLTQNAYIYLRKTHAGYIDVKRIWLER